MINANSYYAIACNDFWYLRDAVKPTNCNPAAGNAAQVAENMIKSVAELTCVDIDKLMTSHNIRAIYDEINKVDTSLNLNRRDLALLKDYFFETRYPGDNFVLVSPNDLKEALEIMLDVVTAVTTWRKAHDLEALIENPAEEFSSTLQRFDTDESPKKINI